MVTYEIKKSLEDLYNKCDTLQKINELEEEIQIINKSLSEDRWYELCTEDQFAILKTDEAKINRE